MEQLQVHRLTKQKTLSSSYRLDSIHYIIAGHNLTTLTPYLVDAIKPSSAPLLGHERLYDVGHKRWL